MKPLRILIVAFLFSIHGAISAPKATALIWAGEERDQLPAPNLTQVQPGRYGPFATLRRANEVAHYYRTLGFDAQIIYGGTFEYREYYVDVW
jgi:hypothetical protein